MPYFRVWLSDDEVERAREYMKLENREAKRHGFKPNSTLNSYLRGCLVEGLEDAMVRVSELPESKSQP